MVDLTFILDANELISADDLDQRSLDPDKKAMLLAQRSHVRRRLDNLSCPEHGQPPRVTAAGPSPDRLTFSVQACCQQLADDARATLEAGTPEDAQAARQARLAEPPMAGQRASGGQTEPCVGPVIAGAGMAAVEEREGTPELIDDEELKLEAIRRQLDIEFPSVVGGGDAGRKAGAKTEAQAKMPPPNRVSRALVVVGTLILVGVVGSLAGALTTTWHVRSVDIPAVAAREEPRPELETERPRSSAGPRTPPRHSLRVTRDLGTPIVRPTIVQAP